MYFNLKRVVTPVDKFHNLFTQYSSENGFIEALIRGYKDSLINDSVYSYLTQCSSIDDIKLQLSSTYLGSKFSNNPDLTTNSLHQLLLEKFSEEFRFVQSQASGVLAKFIEYTTYGYMINNVILMITGTVHQRKSNDLLQRCHPLGYFKTMPSLSLAKSAHDIYNLVLSETPLGLYFQECLSAEDLNELNIEIIRNKLYKAYLEDFFEFCKKLGNNTWNVMKDLIEFEADRRTVNITLNSLGSSITQVDRQNLYPSIGKLYPNFSSLLEAAESEDDIRLICQNFPDYSDFFDEDVAIDDKFYHKEAELCKLAFLQQFNYGFVYAWTKLKEAEIRNVIWITECILQKQHDKINNIISIV